MTRQSCTPGSPAFSPDSAQLVGASQTLVLRRSGVMLAAQGLFVLAATLAVYRCFASHLGAWHALPLVFAVGACLVLCALRHERSRPVALKISVDGLTVWDRAGRLLVKGQITGCAQWSDRLLVLALMPEHGRLHTLLLPADTLAHSAFRKMAVLGRRAAGA